MRNYDKISFRVFLLVCTLMAYALNMQAAEIPAGQYYFDNTNTNWSKVYFRFGNDGSVGDKKSYATAYEMTKMSDNKSLYYINIPSTIYNVKAIQFSASSGKTGSVSIYDNELGNDQKTIYCENGGANFSNVYSCFVAKTNIYDKGYRDMVVTKLMPNGFTSTNVTLNGNESGSTSYYTAGQKVPVVGQTTLTYNGSYIAPDPDEIHATLNYRLTGSSSYSQISAAKTNTVHQKRCTATVTLPSTTGQYTMTSYFQCGSISNPTKYTHTYHIVGMTTSKSSLAFGSIKAGTTKSIDVDLTNVWNGSGTCNVAAELEGAGAGHFGLSTDVVSVTNKSGRVTVTFQPDGEAESADVTAELVLTLPYNSTSLTKRIPISGSIMGNQLKVNVAQEPTFGSGVSASTLTVTLYGNMKSSSCLGAAITEYGFFYDTSSHPDNSLNPSSTPGIKLTSSNASPAGPVAGSIWSATASAFSENTTYYYRAYAIASSNTYFSSEKTFTTGKGSCNYVLGDTVYVTIDKDLDDNVPCELKYNNFRDAIALIKASPFSTSNKLNYPIVFEVVPYDGDAGVYADGTDKTGRTTGGGAYDLPSIWFENINNASSPNYDLIVRSANKNKKPTIQHPTIHNSRKIIFDNVRLQGSKSAGVTSRQYDNALDICCDVDVREDKGVYYTDWYKVASGKFPSSGDAGIVIKHCYIWSKGFTCVHIAGYRGVEFEDNDIEAELALEELSDADKTNTLQWGSSLKVFQCEKFKFIRNSFRGSHATSLWIQGLKNGLIMNNVFWNSNDLFVSGYENATAFIRLVTQFNNDGDQKGNFNDKIGIYYNTFYLAENSDVTDDRNVDFFRLGSNAVYDGSGNIVLNKYNSQNTIADIRFWYNNCYSYDTYYVKGANINNTPEKDRWYQGSTNNAWCSSIMYNNYWSKYDETLTNPTTSVFLIPNCDPNTQYFTNIAEIVCATSSSDPASLVVKGDKVNLGTALTSNMTGLGENGIFNDRTHPSNGSDAVRKTSGEWTLGAYQQTDGSESLVKEIIWWGGEGDTDEDKSNWDNRNNWRKRDEAGNYSRLTCVDNLSTDLKVIIPAPHSDKYQVPDETGITYYPVVPRKFVGDRIDVRSETVNAGQGLTSPTKFAGSIYIEYGGVLKGVQYLNDDDARRYEEATTNFVAGRDQWILVGTVVMKFTDENRESVRLLQSGDFYKDLAPNVYMSEASLPYNVVEDRAVFTWGNPFSNLWESVPYNKVFSIMAPDEYGVKRYSAARYSRLEGKEYDPDEPQEYEFTGWFLNDNISPEYDTNGNPVLFCNTLPANIGVKEAQDYNGGSIYFMDYSQRVRTFVHPADIASKSYEIKSGNGFLFVPDPSENDGFFRMPNSILMNTSTEYNKRSEVPNPYVSVSVYNVNGGSGSVASVVLDDLKDDVYTRGKDLNNIISNEAPEVGIDRYGRNLDYVVIPSFHEPIPLIVEARSTTTIGFGLYGVYDVESVILEDRETGAQYDLLENGDVNIRLAKGEYRNRFYLNIGVNSDDIPTVIDDNYENNDASQRGIDINSDGKEVIISSSEYVELKEACITDLSGATKVVKLGNAHYNRLNMSGMHGVYIINAVGDSASKTEKVIVK